VAFYLGTFVIWTLARGRFSSYAALARAPGASAADGGSGFKNMDAFR